MPKVAVLIPCYNEALTIPKVVHDFRTVWPFAEIHVCDNASTDDTGNLAREAGARVWYEPRKGKGHAVRRLLRSVDADWYLLVDGDATYEARLAPDALDLAGQLGLDLVNISRRETQATAYRAGHRWGNQLLTGTVQRLFGNPIKDMLSGYKLFSRAFVDSFAVQSNGFDIETEIVVHALTLNLPVGEMAGPYYPRPEGSVSKLQTWPDGFRILFRVLNLVRQEKPLPLFLGAGGLLILLSLGLGLPLFWHFWETGTVPRLPTAVLATGIMLVGLLSSAVGLILDGITRFQRENRLLTLRRTRP
ncbi:glycosyltransferase family 2 protein [Acidithiobacillus thiooxidans]|uniref:glycosyltransferase family 2 protein n=2 Tax=Acidithiobacillus thiooxidans TaxID=930 RepID=UPI0004E1D2E1|nr:glycosyltransferase family 2 protein [Acidithiobacillus thiooxidans]